MCQQCLDAIRRHYPDLSQEDQYELLMGATAFPFALPEHIEAQLAELKEKTDGTLNGALAFAHDELLRQLVELNKSRPDR